MSNNNNENKLKHLEFIQNIITRMNSNSFQIKGLTITVVSALLAVYASNKNIDFILISIFPTIIFWFLDAYYLWQERKFRGLYNDVAGVTANPRIIQLFEMRPDLYVGGKYNYFKVFFSKTIWVIYFSIISVLIIIYLILKIEF